MSGGFFIWAATVENVDHALTDDDARSGTEVALGRVSPAADRGHRVAQRSCFIHLAAAGAPGDVKEAFSSNITREFPTEQTQLVRPV